MSDNYKAIKKNLALTDTVEAIKDAQKKLEQAKSRMEEARKYMSQAEGKELKPLYNTLQKAWITLLELNIRFDSDLRLEKVQDEDCD